MGQSQSADVPRQLTTEQLSHELALRFAAKCFTHLEITHFKDNFKTLADHQDGIEYWKEETLCRFLCLPDALQVGPVVYQMATYIGAFPFPSLAPCILTREAMITVVTIMTERYGKVLRRGKRDRIRLQFRSLAVFDRESRPPVAEKPTMEQLVAEQKLDDMLQEEAALKGTGSHMAGFAIDEPANDDLDEDEDDDELALAALDALDAIEVFREDQRIVMKKKIHHAQIPRENLKRLLLLLLFLAPLGPQENLAQYGEEDLSPARLQGLEAEAESILASFDPDDATGGIRYASFTKAISTCLPFLFEPLSALFEHFLFSKNIDLSRHRDLAAGVPPPAPSSKFNHIVSGPTDTSSILTPAVLSHLSTFLITRPLSTAPPVSLFHAGTSFHPVYSTTSQGTSLTSFARHVLSWQSSTLLLVTGTQPNPHPPPASKSITTITIGAFLPSPWSKHTTPSSSTDSTNTPYDPSQPQPVLFLLSPHHALLPHNPHHHMQSSTAHFSPKSGIALGCIIPPSSRSSAASQNPVLGPVALQISSDLSTATFQHDANGGTGAYLPDSGLEKAQAKAASGGIATVHHYLSRRFEFEIDTLEVWGIINSEARSDGEGDGDEVQKQKQRLEWEEMEAKRRAGVNFGGDREGARQLLEMAGLVGGGGGGVGQGRSGGSV